MSASEFISCYTQSSFILTEGAIAERLKREFQVQLDENINHAGLIYEKQVAVLERIYLEYIDIAVSYHVPIMLMTPTRRANRVRIGISAYSDKNVIHDNVGFLTDLRRQYQEPIFIGGLMGCKGDAYNPGGTLTTAEALEFHLWQAEQFQNAGVDYLYAGIMPALPEATGIAEAMEKTGLPYIISFMIRDNGRLLDGTTIHEAIERIDRATIQRPLCYMVNCVHPDILNKALAQPFNQTDLIRRRFAGIQANASALSPEELNHSNTLRAEGPKELAEATLNLRSSYSFLKIFGGCCGTDQQYIESLAQKMPNSRKEDKL